MGPFIQGRMVLPFQLERTESLFLSSSRRETLQLACLENHSTTFTALLRVKQWQEKSSSSLCTENQHREMLTLRCSNFILQGSFQLTSPAGSRHHEYKSPVKLINIYLYLCNFIKYCLVDRSYDNV